MTAPQPSGDPGALAPGTGIGHYTIIEKLGEGGEAIVYRARDLLLDRDVALKTPRGEVASAKERAHLLKEARTASRLSHPFIVPIHEAFEDQGRPWFAMGLAEGTTLRRVMAHRGAIPAEEVARYGEMLADALRAAHAKRVLHRDVTPGNIFITPDGRLLLGDFGLACAPADPDATTTAFSRDHAVGTLGYMSPEQMMGREVGPQTDIFSAGVVLYQMATGRIPFGGATLGEVLDGVLNRELPPASESGGIPADLDHILRKALAKRLDERYASAEDMFIDLRALRRRLESGSSGAVQLARPRRWNRAALASLGTLAAVAVLAAGALLARWLTRPPILPLAVPHQVTTDSGWEAQPRISPNGTDIVYVAEDEAGNTNIWLVDAGGGVPIRLTTGPASDHSPAWFPDGGAIAFVSDRGGTPGVWKIPRLGGQTPTLVVASARAPAISPDGTRIAFARPDAGGDDRIVVAPLSDTADAKVLTTARDGLWGHRYPAWSPDGRTICYSGHADLWTVPADGGPPARLTVDGDADYEPVWSPDGRWVYFSSMRGGTTAIWRVASAGGAPERVTMGTGPESQPSLSRDGTRLAYSTFALNSNLVVHNLRDDTEYEFGGERRELSPAFAPDGSALAYVSDEAKSPPDLWVQPLLPNGSPAGRARRLTEQPGSATHPSYSPDGRWIVYYRVAQNQRDIWIVPAAGGEPARFTDDPAADIHPAWSPDGTEIAFISERGGSSRVWLAPVAGGRPAGAARALTSGAGSDFDPAWSPDSSLIAYGHADATGVADVWLLDRRGSGAPRRLTRGADVHSLAWGAAPGQILAAGTWGTAALQLMSIDAATGRVVPFGPPLAFGRQADSGDFAASADGRLLAFVRQTARGDVWVMDATRGRF